MIIADPAPLRHIPIFFIRAPGSDELFPGYLKPIVHVVQHVKYLVLIRQVLHRILVRIGENLPHPSHEILPIIDPVEMVRH